MRIKRIGKSKVPTIAQLQSMAENLRNKFDNYASIDLSVNHFRSGNTRITYSVWVASDYSPHAGLMFETNSWHKCLAKYYKLMKANSLSEVPHV
jgi:hypothetical protein